MEIGVVILNYLSYKVTIDTVDSFLKQNHTNINVRYVIVDNCSPNESFAILKKKYVDYPEINVIRSEQNLGFARGNDLGYKELLKMTTPDFVVFSNDDILLPKDGLFQWIVDSYEKYKFAVLGPDVYSINGNFHQNPMKRHSKNIKDLKHELKSMYLYILRCRLKKMLRRKPKTTVPTWNNEHYMDFCDHLTLHGSFQVFSSIYFSRYQLPYDERTFLYFEEDIVRIRCDKFNLRCVYDPTYSIQHLQAVSTNMVTGNYFDKEIKRAKNCIKSLKVYIRSVKELDEIKRWIS